MRKEGLRSINIHFKKFDKNHEAEESIKSEINEIENSNIQ